MKKYVGITGGNFFNKGAEAMTCIAINELAQKFPNREIVVFSVVPDEAKHNVARNYNVTIRPPYLYYKRKCLSDVLYYFFYNKGGVWEKETIQYLNNMECIVDISGFGLRYHKGKHASEFWTYIHNIWVAAKYNIPIYLLPQSHGPICGRNKIEQMLLDVVLKIVLAKPQKIYVREKYALRVIKKYRGDVIYAPDMVLNYNKVIDYTKIYKNIKSIDIDIPEKSVVIVPNTRNVDNTGKNFLPLYEKSIKVLLDKGFEVYILLHSKDDKNECIRIKKAFKNDARVHLDVNNYTSFQLEEIIAQFSFAIASRYHSIVHAYKHAVPCVVLGWAEKYDELMQMFRQERYCIDVRKEVKESLFLEKLLYMVGSYEQEKQIIESKYHSMKFVDIYQEIGEKK